jgi:hypothetical protein
MTYFQTKFDIPSSTNSLVIAIDPKAKYIFHVTAMLLFKIYKSFIITI